MSVSVDKYFGWTIDLKTDLNCNDFDFYHKFIDKHPNLDQWKNCMPKQICGRGTAKCNLCNIIL